MPERTRPSIKDRVSLGIATFLILFLLVDFGGDYIAVVALKAAYHSRKDDCNNSEVIRKQLRAKTVEAKAELPQTLKRLPAFNTPFYREKIAKQFALEDRENAAVDCTAYANRALPW